MLSLLSSKLNVCVPVSLGPLPSISSSRRLRLMQLPSFCLNCTSSSYFYACYLVIYNFVSAAFVLVGHLFSLRRAWSLRRGLSELLRRAFSLRIICLVLRGAPRCPVLRRACSLRRCLAELLRRACSLRIICLVAGIIYVLVPFFQVLSVSQGSRVTYLVYIFI